MVDDKQILDIVHQMATAIMVARDGEMAEYGPAVDAGSTDSLIDRYGFCSIDTLKFLLTLEEKFGVTLADEDFSDEMVSSAAALASRIAGLRQASVLALGTGSTA